MATNDPSPSAAPGTSRAAHRPSRRAKIIQSAISLFVRTPFDEVKVADIAALADLTPAAVHYHFDGKEQILLEAMRDFSSDLLGLASSLVAGGADPETIVSALLKFIRSKRTAATVFYVTANGLSLSFEAHRKIVRADLAELMAQSARNGGSKRPEAESDVIGAALTSIIEVAATSTLRSGDVGAALGARKLNAIVTAMVARVIA